MAKIIVALTPGDIGKILSHEEVSITPSVRKFDNLTEVIIKCYQYDTFPTLEVKNDD